MSGAPLAEAARRLRRPPGRPKTKATPEKPEKHEKPGRARQARHVAPRLLTVDGVAAYLSLSLDAVRDLAARGELTRVRLPGPNGSDLRVCLYDRADLDALIECSRDLPARGDAPREARRVTKRTPRNGRSPVPVAVDGATRDLDRLIDQAKDPEPAA